MKPALSKNDGKKRKRTEMAPPSAPESPKRNKVHAQRKFAQGTGLSVSPTVSPMKERERPPARPVSPPLPPPPPINLPKTTDFLNFICFKRSPLLAPSINFIRMTSVTSSTAAKPSPSTAPKTATKPNEKKVVAKKKLQPAGVAALCKKYQEQRLAKQKASSVTTLAKKVKGKNMVRTRATAVSEETVKSIKKKVGGKTGKGRLGLRSGLQRTQSLAISVKNKLKKKKKKNLERAGLRSGGRVEEVDVPIKTPPVPKVKKPDVVKKSKVVAVPLKTMRRKKLAVEREIGSDFSSDDNEPLLAHRRIRGSARPVRTRSRPTQPEGRTARPSRRTKVAAALHMEIMTRRLTSPGADDELSSTDTTPDRSSGKRTDKRDSSAKSSPSTKAIPSRKSLPKASTPAKRVVSKSPESKKEKVSKEKRKEEEKTSKEKKGEGIAGKEKRMEEKVSKEIRTEEKVVKERRRDEKEQVRKEPLPERPSTRSHRQDEKPLIKKELPVFKKPAIRTLIQKKKLNSLRTLTRLGTKKLSQNKIPPAFQTADKAPEKKIEATKEPKAVNETTKESKKVEVTKEVKKIEVAKEVKKIEVAKEAKKSGNDIEKEPKMSVESAKEVKKAVNESIKLRGKIGDAVVGEKPKKPVVKKEATLNPEPKTRANTIQLKKTPTKKPKQVIEVEVGGLSKRPPRKCSAVDKIWIDIDGFTSDEDDFVDLESIAALKDSKPAKAPEPKKPKGKTGVKPPVVKESKTASVGSTPSTNEPSSAAVKPNSSQATNAPVETPTLSCNSATDPIATPTLTPTPKTAPVVTPASSATTTASISSPSAKASATQTAKVNTVPTARTNATAQAACDTPGAKLSAASAVKTSVTSAAKTNATPAAKVVASIATKGTSPATPASSSLPPPNNSATDKPSPPELPAPTPATSTAAKCPSTPLRSPDKPSADTKPTQNCSESKSTEVTVQTVFVTSPAPLVPVPKITVVPSTSLRETPSKTIVAKALLVSPMPPITPTKAEMDDYSHALIARLAASVSMSAKPLNLSNDSKVATKELIAPMVSPGIIKMESPKEQKMDVKSAGLVKPSVDDKASIVPIANSSTKFLAGDLKGKTDKGFKTANKMSHLFEGEKKFGAEIKNQIDVKVNDVGKKGKDKLSTIAKVSESKLNIFDQKRVSDGSIEEHAGASKELMKRAFERKEATLANTSQKSKEIAGSDKTISPSRSSEDKRSPFEVETKRNNFPATSNKNKRAASQEKESKIPEKIAKTGKSNSREIVKDVEKKRVDSEKGKSPKSVNLPKKSGKDSRGLRGSRPILPRSTAEAIVRRERPKRQCSVFGKALIERDSDDSSFYQSDDDEDVFELIRRSELAEKEKERAKEQERAKSPSVESKEEMDNFSDSDDEPLKKKPMMAASTNTQTSFSVASHESEPVTKNLVGRAEAQNDGSPNGRVLDVRGSTPPLPPAVRFVPPPREPINTHGLDLLSEVVTLSRDAVADKSTARIEQWLKDSIRSDSGKGFIGFDESEIRQPTAAPVPESNDYAIPNPLVQFVRTPSEPPKPKPPDDDKTQKKVIKKPLEPFLKRPPVSSVQDLLKLQKERKESPKPTQEQHSKNCKCNSCVVRKAWFKNKPVPGDGKPAAGSRESSPAKPFQTLTKAFAEVGTGVSLGKVSASVAPFVANRESPEKAVGPQRKLSFLERMRERERKEAMSKPHPNAFSPCNESSVYAFVPEPERQSTPFRSRTLSRTPSTSTSHEEEVEDAKHQSTSIAVQVNLDSSASPPPELAQPVDDGKSMEISTQTEGAEDDPDSPMFYIPLQQSCAVAMTQPVIQGVALKLGTEGPLGPNQRVIMKAKLVTQTQNVPSVKAVVMPQQKMFENPKNTPPVGTVQPTTRRPPEQSVAPSPALSKTRKGTRAEEVRNQSEDTKVQSRDTPLATSTPKRRPTTPTPKRRPPTPTPATSKETRESGVGGDAPLATPSASKRESKGSAMLMEAPTFHLTEKEFQDPLEFFERIRPMAERFGLCRIVPPSSFKPDCKVTDDMRFTAYNQYVHRMLHRWGPSVRETMAMKKYLKTQSISLKPPPCVGGMEVDLPRLYKAVQTCGGLMKVMEKQKWQQVADMLRIPRAAHDRATKLDSIYCQYLLPYETLKPEERTKLMVEVDADWKVHEAKMGVESEAESEGEDEVEDYIEECEDCIVKGRSMALSQFYRIARNTMSMWFKSPEPSPTEVESEYWRHVTDRTEHICVHSGSIDSSGWGYGFPVGKNNFAKHPWNLKVLTNNSGSVIRSLGPVTGVTVPTLHVGMVFASFCWYRDPHGLPWVEYLHTGAPKIWYGISDDNSELFREALTQLLPRHIKKKRIWLPCDTAMAPPERLAQLGVPLCRTTQEPGQFVLVFPRAFTSSLCSGYLVSESVYFARPSWLQTAEQVFRDIHDSAEPSGFSLDNLLFNIAGDSRANLDVLQQVLPMVRKVCEREVGGRLALTELGLSVERLPREPPRRRGRTADPETEYECEQCRASLFLSLVSNAVEETYFCLQHGLQYLTAHSDQLSSSKLLYSYDQDEINLVVEKLEERIGVKLQKSSKK